MDTATGGRQDRDSSGYLHLPSLGLPFPARANRVALRWERQAAFGRFQHPTIPPADLALARRLEEQRGRALADGDQGTAVDPIGQSLPLRTVVEGDDAWRLAPDVCQRRPVRHLVFERARVRADGHPAGV